MTTRNIYLGRLKRLTAILKKEYPAATCIFSSNQRMVSSRDQYFPYRPNSDLYYFTGITAEDHALVIRPDNADSMLLIGPKEDPIKKVWEGEAESAGDQAKDLGIEYRRVQDPYAALFPLTAKSDVLVYQSQPGSLSQRVGLHMAGLKSYERIQYPRILIDSEVVTERLRLFLDPTEVEAIRIAAELTADCLLQIAPFIQPGITEWEIAKTLDYLFAINGGSNGFESIVGTGPSAAALHYHKLKRTLKKGELLLIDCGAKLNMYSADLTRVLPVSGTFSPLQAEVYDIVLEAYHVASEAIRPGIPILKVHDAALKVLQEGLISLKVLKRGTPAAELYKQTKQYFPHGIGHSLGLDIHDVGRIRGGSGTVLEAGMVITIEPGLYFSKPVGRVPAMGIRIEDNFQVTKTGAKNLTGDLFPTVRQEIESLMTGSENV